MILIADSGSTKTSWRYITADNNVFQADTVGFNPYHQQTDDIARTLRDALVPQLTQPDVREVYFYGAGCSSQENVDKVASAFRQTFPSLEQVSVAHDALGAARSLCGDEPGIACILGTGSNSTLYDGKDIVKTIGGLGLWLGDEGSGGYMGRKLVMDFLNEEMPPHLYEKFLKRYKIDRVQVLDNVYTKPFPSRYLASFSKFLFDNLSEAYCYKIVYDSFSDFFDKSVCKYKDFRNYRVHFVGSVAFYYSNILRQVANDKGVVVRNILENPIAGLTLYYQKQKFSVTE